MNNNTYLYILIMAGVTYGIRVMPITLIRKQVNHITVRSFLYYVPFVTLAAMTFPAILHATSSVWSAAAGLLVAVILAYKGVNMFKISIAACLVVFLIEILIC